MAQDNSKDDFIERKTCRRKHLKNKHLDKKISGAEDADVHRPRKENKRRIEEMRQDEIWEDWEKYGR
jgi:hypothetical protein